MGRNRTTAQTMQKMRASWGGNGSDRRGKRRRRTANGRHCTRACKHVQACASMWHVFQVTTTLSLKLTTPDIEQEHTRAHSRGQRIRRRTHSSFMWVGSSERKRSFTPQRRGHATITRLQVDSWISSTLSCGNQGGVLHRTACVSKHRRYLWPPQGPSRAEEARRALVQGVDSFSRF